MFPGSYVSLSPHPEVAAEWSPWRLTSAAVPPMVATIAFWPVNMPLKSPGSGANRSLNPGMTWRCSGAGVSQGWPPDGSAGVPASTPATGGDEGSGSGGAICAEAVPATRHTTSVAAGARSGEKTFQGIGASTKGASVAGAKARRRSNIPLTSHLRVWPSRTALAPSPPSSSLADLPILFEVRQIRQSLGDGHLADEDQALEQDALRQARFAFVAAAQVLELVADDRRQDGDVHILAGQGIVDDGRPAVEVDDLPDLSVRLADQEGIQAPKSIRVGRQVRIDHAHWNGGRIGQELQGAFEQARLGCRRGHRMRGARRERDA